MSDYVFDLILTLCDVVGWLVWGFRKKGLLRLGLFFAVAPCPKECSLLREKKTLLTEDSPRGQGSVHLLSRLLVHHITFAHM